MAILDADKEGFLRSERSLIQTIGRAARNLNGKAILYGDRITDSMAKAIGETERRRAKQQAYNEANGIVPQGLNKKIGDILQIGQPVNRAKNKGKGKALDGGAPLQNLTPKALDQKIRDLEAQMYTHAQNRSSSRPLRCATRSTSCASSSSRFPDRWMAPALRASKFLVGRAKAVKVCGPI